MIYKVGTIPTSNGRKQRYKCWDCGKTFYKRVK